MTTLAPRRRAARHGRTSRALAGLALLALGTSCSSTPPKEVRWETAERSTPIGYELLLYDFPPGGVPPVPLPQGLIRGQAVIARSVAAAVDVHFSDGTVEQRLDPEAPKFVRREPIGDLEITATVSLGGQSRALPPVRTRATGEFAFDLTGLRETVLAMADRIDAVRIDIACHTTPECQRTIAVPIQSFYWGDK